MAKVKRTYNLSERTVRAVRELSERYELAPSQDAVVELAVAELERRLRDSDEARTWETVAADPSFRSETDELEKTYRSADEETWPR